MSRLYLDHFGLRSPPFDLTPNPDFLFTGGKRGELIEAITYAALDSPGIVLVIGEIGSGKTMLCRLIAQRIQQLGHDLIYLDNPSFAPHEILRAMANDWGLPLNTLQPLQWQLQQHLVSRYREGKRVVLLIDEAQAMPEASLEEIRLLSNLESATDKLLRIVLFAQPELDATLANPALRQVRDRIVHRFDIESLSIDEAINYLHHRLHCAGSKGRTILSERAARRIARASGGRIRALHHLAEHSLLAAYAAGSFTVEPKHVRAALKDLRHILPASPARPATRRSTVVLVLSLGAILAAGLGWLAFHSYSPPEVTPVSSTTNAPAPPKSATVPTSAATPVSSTSPDAPAPSALAAPPESAPPPRSTTSSPAQPVRVSGAVSPVTRQHAWRDLLQQGQRILDDPQGSGFTVQLLIERNADHIARQLASKPALPRQTWVLPRLYTPNQATPTYALFVGRFNTKAEAYNFIRQLPPAWQQYQPQVRSLAALRKEPRPPASAAVLPTPAADSGADSRLKPAKENPAAHAASPTLGRPGE